MPINVLEQQRRLNHFLINRDSSTTWYCRACNRDLPLVIENFSIIEKQSTRSKVYQIQVPCRECKKKKNIKLKLMKE